MQDRAEFKDGLEQPGPLSLPAVVGRAPVPNGSCFQSEVDNRRALEDHPPRPLVHFLNVGKG